jgi:hypothetical protein
MKKNQPEAQSAPRSSNPNVPQPNPIVERKKEVIAEIRMANLRIAGNVSNLGILDRMDEFEDK